MYEKKRSKLQKHSKIKNFDGIDSNLAIKKYFFFTPSYTQSAWFKQPDKYFHYRFFKFTVCVFSTDAEQSVCYAF